jgi:hypothetical protein
MKSPQHFWNFLGSFVSISLLLSLIGCNGPDNTTKKFTRAIFAGDAETALDQACGTMIIVAIRMDWRDDYYEEIYKDDYSAQVRVVGNLRMTAGDLNRFAAMAKQYYDIDLPDLKNAQFQLGMQVGIKFDGIYLSYNDHFKKWCIESKTMLSFVEYLGNLFTTELVKMMQE